MTIQTLFVVGILGTVAAMETIPSESASSVESTLFTTPVGDAGQKLVVVRGPDCNAKLLRGLGPNRALEQVGNLYEIRVELHTPNERPLVLASRLRSENHATAADRGVHILACIVERGEVVLGLAEGHALVLWKIGVDPQISGTHLTYSLVGWQVGAAGDRLNAGKVGMKIAHMDDGRLSVEVTDQRAGKGPTFPTTRYEQPDVKVWEFRIANITKKL